MMSIKFFGICQESMISYENLEKCYEGGDTVSGTQSSHHFVLLSSSQTDHKLISEGKSYVDIHYFNVSTFLEIGDISPSAYVTCIYNLFWSVGMVSLVEIAATDVTDFDFIHPHGPRKTFNSNVMFLSRNIQKISTPATSTARAYKVNDENYKKLFLHLTNFSNNKLSYIAILLLPFAKYFISVGKCLIRNAKT